MSGILILEDEPIIARNILRALGRAGHGVTHAASAAAARVALDAQDYDLVIADISLGDGDGIEVLAACSARLASVPVIVMTGQDNVENRLRAEQIPVSAFLCKPFAMSTLCELSSALLMERAGPSGRRGPTVMMYSHDTIGLGHMRRNTAIARALVARVPGVSVLMLVGCPAGMVFEPHPGIDYVKLPSLAKVARGKWQAGSLRLDAATTRALRAGVVEQVVRTFAPDVFLVDHEPAGVWNELVAPLTALREAGRTRVILGLRDILDDPDRVSAAWAASGVDRVIATLYDRILIYGNAGFYPTDQGYGLQALLPGRVHYCGAVTAAAPSSGTAWRGAPRRVVASGGGGRDSFPLLDCVLRGFERISPRLRPELTVILGPLMDEELRAELAGRARLVGAICRDTVADLPAMLARSDLFIAMGGYNSIAEALVSRCPTVVVPRVGPSGEQRIRAERLLASGLASVVWRQHLTPERMAVLMTARCPVVSAKALAALSFDGAAAAAAQIGGALAEQCQLDNREARQHA